jgi:hypothetical protein
MVVCGMALALAVGAVAQPGAPAPPDTAIARFSWPGQPPTALTVWPDEALFGQEILVVLDHADGARPTPVDSLRVDVPWLEPVGLTDDPGELPLPPPEGPRQLARFRIYREGPWRAAWGDGPAGPTLAVSGRVDDPGAIEPVRDPRAIGGIPRWLLVAVAILLLAAAVAVLLWRWRRRRRRPPVAHRQLAPPAWLEAAIALRGLEQQALLDRDHLDALAAIVRRYVHGRFFIAAEEMTAAEIRAAAGASGWRSDQVHGFADLLADCDDARYAPDLIGSVRLRECLQQALDLIDAVRIEPIWTPVAPGELAEAHAAWAFLRERYPALEPEGRAAC